MKEKPGRRSFIKKIGMSGLSAAMLPPVILNAAEQQSENDYDDKQVPGPSRAYNSPYKGDHLNRVAFPIGGLGAGMFCMEGTGAISHMSVKNKPDIFNEPGIFAGISIKGLQNGAKILEGPVPDWKKFGARDSGNGSTGAAIGSGFRIRGGPRRKIPHRGGRHSCPQRGRSHAVRSGRSAAAAG